MQLQSDSCPMETMASSIHTHSNGREHYSMPPASGYEILADQLVNLISEIECLRSEVHELKESTGKISVGNLIEVNEDIRDIKQMILKKSEVPETKKGSYADALGKSKIRMAKGNEFGLKSSCNLSRPADKDVATTSRYEHETPPRLLLAPPPSPVLLKNDTTKPNDGIGKEWQTVRRKKPDVLRGRKKTTDGNFKGVRQTFDVYIGRCDKSVKEEDLVVYMKNELKVNVVDCLCLSSSEYYFKSFKVTIFAENKDVVFTPDMWPENITVRRYFRAKQQKS